jgi:hypothetical protein
MAEFAIDSFIQELHTNAVATPSARVLASTLYCTLSQLLVLLELSIYCIYSSSV